MSESQILMCFFFPDVSIEFEKRNHLDAKFCQAENGTEYGYMSFIYILYSYSKLYLSTYGYHVFLNAHGQRLNISQINSL